MRRRHRIGVGKPPARRSYLVKVTRTLTDHVVIPVRAGTPKEASAKAEEIAFVDANMDLDWQEDESEYVKLSSSIQRGK